MEKVTLVRQKVQQNGDPEVPPEAWQPEVRGHGIKPAEHSPESHQEKDRESELQNEAQHHAGFWHRPSADVPAPCK